MTVFFDGKYDSDHFSKKNIFDIVHADLVQSLLDDANVVLVRADDGIVDMGVLEEGYGDDPDDLKAGVVTLMRNGSTQTFTASARTIRLLEEYTGKILSHPELEGAGASITVEFPDNDVEISAVHLVK